ncbi:MAG TPA: HipA domain-containing protein [Stellaceae bacterium]|jgi:serine/threonine-protein kinase HipA|nr:HipA domain-containing protein [Stellaceae bacterium]
MLGDLATSPLGLGDDDFRISLAGAQEKIALLHRDNRWYKPTSVTATTHILKPQIGCLPNSIDLSCSVENEFLCLKICAALGLPSAAVDISEFGGKRVLVVERFDRRWTRDRRLLRLPQEDCCQALSVPPTLKYEAEGGPGIQAILDLLRGSDDPAADQQLFLRAVIVFWLLGATDGHAKNFSLFLAPGGRFRMTPLYDVVSAQPSADEGQIRRNQLKLAMAVGDSRHYVVETILRHFIQTAGRAGIAAPVVRAILEDLQARADFELIESEIHKK